jgi:putative addiction module antidote
MTTAHITEFGNALGIVLPPAILEKLNVASGDQLCFIDTPNGVELTSLTPHQAEQLKVARQVIAENRESLEELAK